MLRVGYHSFGRQELRGGEGTTKGQGPCQLPGIRDPGLGDPQQVKESRSGASLVAQWLRIHLPMQGTRVRALVWEDPTCRGATQPVCHNY